MLNKTTAVFKPFIVESSVIVFNGRLLVGYTSRVPAEIGKLVFVDYFTGDRIASVSSQGLSLGCMFVTPGINGTSDTLHYWGSQNVGTAGNTICHMQTSDPMLLTWTTATGAWQAGHPQQKLFNTSVCFDGSRYFMAYETSEPYYGYVDFNIRWLVSTDLVNWSPYGNVYGSNRYVACPWMHYEVGYYYMIYLVNEGGLFKLRAARATDPSGTWIEATKIVMSPTIPDELINVSDWDCVEFGGNVYGTYAAGDQGNGTSNAMDLKQTFIYGTLAAYCASLFL